ncbi:MAG: iron-sulfur cluster assembly scaffold protein, partial [Sphingosinicella sp.]|nr:iron-sulfur cluster assembly scaffold protein [Sphingosinicella sp.]
APELRATHTALAAFLKGEADVPANWPDLEIFRPAQAYKARHPSILLAFDAAASAAEVAAVTASG